MKISDMLISTIMFFLFSAGASFTLVAGMALSIDETSIVVAIAIALICTVGSTVLYALEHYKSAFAVALLPVVLLVAAFVIADTLTHRH